MSPNQAAYLTGAGEPLAVREAPSVPHGPNDVTIKTHAFALNPADVIQADTGFGIKHWPHILGCDAAGVVEGVGANVKHVKPGDRVFGMSAKTTKDPETNAMEMVADAGAGGYQQYAVITAQHTGRLPENVSFEEGSVLPLGILTASSALYFPQCLGLPFPSKDAKARDEYVFVWGGASSVGTCGVQLARSSGYKVITTCSAKNAGYCKDIGAEEIFDYHQSGVVSEVTKYLKGKKYAGAFDAISKDGTVEKCIEIAQNSMGSKKIMTVIPGLEKEKYPKDVEVGAVFAHLEGSEALKVFEDFLPQALESGSFKAKPDPLVVGTGLEYAQKAIDTARAGVSARKVVVSL
ncbi:hypothetical protein MMC10_003235 [Thelotrema lepadinum]|nr:hypothetical protein [Thelotrema lepadinum]